MFIELKKIKEYNNTLLYDIYLRPSIGVSINNILEVLGNLEEINGLKINYRVRKLDNSPLEAVSVKGVSIQFIMALGNCFRTVNCKVSDCSTDKYYNYTRGVLEKVMHVY